MITSTGRRRALMETAAWSPSTYDGQLAAGLNGAQLVRSDVAIRWDCRAPIDGTVAVSTGTRGTKDAFALQIQQIQHFAHCTFERQARSDEFIRKLSTTHEIRIQPSIGAGVRDMRSAARPVSSQKRRPTRSESRPKCLLDGESEMATKTLAQAQRPYCKRESASQRPASSRPKSLQRLTFPGTATGQPRVSLDKSQSLALSQHLMHARRTSGSTSSIQYCNSERRTVSVF